MNWNIWHLNSTDVKRDFNLASYWRLNFLTIHSMFKSLKPLYHLSLKTDQYLEWNIEIKIIKWPTNTGIDTHFQSTCPIEQFNNKYTCTTVKFLLLTTMHDYIVWSYIVKIKWGIMLKSWEFFLFKWEKYLLSRQCEIVKIKTW